MFFRFPVIFPAGFMVPAAAFYLAAGQVRAAEPVCESGPGYQSICNIGPPEDLEPTPDGRFMFMGITPGMDGAQVPRLQILDRKNNQGRDIELVIAPEVGWGDADCKAPEQPMGAHGIHLSERRDGRHQLLVVNHNGREAIEFLEVAPEGDTWTTTWRGCVENEGLGRFNDVAALPVPESGFVATVMFEAESMHTPPPLDELLSGSNTGYLMSWGPADRLAKVPGSDAPFPNGIEISADGRYAWFAAWTAREVRKFDLNEHRIRAQIPVGFMPDNLSWDNEGRLLAAGIRNPDTFAHCMTNRIADCPFGFKVAAVDTIDNTSTNLFTAGAGILSGVSVAVQVDDYIYVGAFNGDRMIRLDPRPNILLIMADDLGFSDLGSYGGEIETPTLDELADEGLRMSSFYVAPTCSPTRAMLISGTDNHLVGLGTMAEVLPFSPALQGRPDYEGHINKKAHSLPQLLKDAGYNTYMAGKWHLGKAPEQDPSAFGFDKVFTLLDGGASHFKPIEESTVRVENVTYRENGKTVEVPEGFFSTDFYTDKLISYIDSGRDNGQPFFAWLAYTAPHWPLQAPEEYIEKYRGEYDGGYEAVRQKRTEKIMGGDLFETDFVPAKPADVPSKLWQDLTKEERQVQARKMEVYAAMVEHMDASIGRLFHYLKQTGQYDNTLVVFISDNGAAGEDHTRGYSPGDEYTDNSLANIGRRGSNVNYGFRWAEVSSTPFSLVKGTSAEGGISSPAIVRVPGSMLVAPAGSVVHGYGRIDDLLPTFLEVAVIEDPGTTYNGEQRRKITGQSLLTTWQENPQLRSKAIGGEMFAQPYIRQGDWKLRSAHAPDGSAAMLSRHYQWQLFNLAEDRGETKDLSGQHPGQVKMLLEEWQRYVEWAGVAEPE
jgi:arylsulfatase